MGLGNRELFREGWSGVVKFNGVSGPGNQSQVKLASGEDLVVTGEEPEKAIPVAGWSFVDMSLNLVHDCRVHG